MESDVQVDCVDSDSRKSYVKIGLIYNAIKYDLGIEVVKCILQTEGDINYDFSKSQDKVPDLLSVSPTIISEVDRKFDYFKLLLDSGADFTRKNHEGKTIVHQRFYTENSYRNNFADLLLSAHVKFNNFLNPSDENGMTHFHIACIVNNALAVEFFLKNGVDVNQTVNSKSFKFPLYSPLHFAARYACLESIEILLKYGANVHLKSMDGMSPIHLLIWMFNNMLRLSELPRYEKALDILATFVIGNQNIVNLVDDYGFSKFHWAAMIQDESLVEDVLKEVENLNQPVNSDSPVCPGYTPFHFATFSNVNVFKLLLNKGSDVEAKNARGLTAFELGLQKYNVTDVHSILLSKPEWKNIVLSDNKTMLTDIVFAMKDVDEFILFLNSTNLSMKTFVPSESPLWPGYTLLHLAVVLSEKINLDEYFSLLVQKDNVKIVEECIKRGSDIKTTDAIGSTALHVAFYMEKRCLVEFLLDHHDKSGNPVDKNNLSHFHIASAARHVSAVEKFLSIGVDVNSQVQSTFKWHIHYENELGYPYRHFYICPGSTALHINVASANSKIMKMLLKRGSDVNLQDVNGFTPLHRVLPAKVNRLDLDPRLLLSVKNLKNSTTHCELTHLHVASSVYDNEKGVKKLLKLGANIDEQLTYKCDKNYLYYSGQHDFDRYGDPDNPLGFLAEFGGFTPLHFSYQPNYDCERMLMLIERNADVLIKDDKGVSSLEKLLKMNECSIPYSMFNKNPVIQTCLEKEYGITKLHLACAIVDYKLVKNLIKRGENVNAKVHSNCPIWKGYTPLHLVAKIEIRDSLNGRALKGFVEKMKKCISTLTENEADVLSMNDENDTPLHLTWNTFDNELRKSVASNLFEKIDNFKMNPTNKQRISVSHIACITENLPVIKKFLNNGVDVSQAVSHFSEKYPGCTPLHLILKTFRLSTKFDVREETFLQIVDLLLENGCDINATDAFGNTPLFEAILLRSDLEDVIQNKQFEENEMTLRKLRRILIEKFISYGANVHVKNLGGETSFELLLKFEDTTLDDIQLFLNSGCHLNVYNPITREGYMAKIFHSHWSEQTKIMENPFFQKIIDNPQINKLNDVGRTAIHNVVSTDDVRDKHPHWFIQRMYIDFYAELIEQLIIRGCDIDHQDNEGKTALHLAASFKNNRAILELLAYGTDINITDSDGDTAFAYCYETMPDDYTGFDFQNDELAVDYDRNYAVKVFAAHVYKLEFCGLPVNRQNMKMKIDIENIDTLKEFPVSSNKLDSFHCAIEKSKNLKIGDTSLCIYDFLTKTDVDVIYTNMTSEERREVDEFFVSLDNKNFPEYCGLLRLKYRRTIERTKLIEPAMESLNILIKYQLPELCCRHILQFLKNEDLKCLIASCK